MSTQTIPAKYTSKDWNEVRAAFAASIMVDTSLNSLAQNLDGPEWPIKSKAETPAGYIDLTHEELIEMLALKGLGADRADLLIGILKDTLAFDDPFGEMVQQAHAAAEKDNPLLKNLARLEIPESFPIALTALSPSTLEFCQLEKLGTLGAFAVFAQSMSQNVIIGGDFRKLLNALSHVDERTLAECVPFRPGAKGLHLIEALAQATRAPVPSEHAASAIEWFKDEFAELKHAISTGQPLARHLMVLGNPAMETKVVELLKPYLGRGAATVGGEKKIGLFGSLSRLFRK